MKIKEKYIGAAARLINVLPSVQRFRASCNFFFFRPALAAGLQAWRRTREVP